MAIIKKPPNGQKIKQDRTGWKVWGYKVLRFTNEDIFHDIESVISIINNNIDLPFKV